jgi:hypothetical protein
MALVDPNIALSYRVPNIQPQNALADYAAIQQIQGGQQTQKLNQLKMQEYERARTEEEGLRNYLAKSDLAKPETRAGLVQYGKTGLAYGKALTEQDTAALTQQEMAFKVQKSKNDFIAQAKRDTSNNPSDANLTAFKEDLTANPLFTAAEKTQLAANVDRILAMPVGDRRAFMASQGASASELQPKVSVGPTGIVQTPAYGGAATVVPGTGAAFQMTPAQIAQGRRDQQRLGLEGQRVGLEQARVNIAQTEADRKMQGMEALPPKEIQKREAVLPQATAAVKGFEAKSASFVKDLTELRNHPGLSEITGIAAGRLPGITKEGRAAQALYDKVVAKGGFQALQDMRDASKTGGALGNVSNQEGKQLTASFAAINRTQDAPDVQNAIDQAIADIAGSQTRMREAYDATYAYKAGAPSATAAKPALSAVDQQALQWANSNAADPRAAAIKQRLGM